MDETQKRRLRENRVKIVSDLEPRGKVLDILYEDGVLTENDLEKVASATTRKDRCQILLSLLPSRGPQAYGSFQKALNTGNYDFLANQLNPEAGILHENIDSSRVAGNETCKQCSLFLEKVRREKKKQNGCLSRIMADHCCLLVDNIEPKDVIDQLFQDHVITADDIDRTVACATRRDRCETLFEILLTNENHKVVESLKVALTKKYAYIVENVSNNFDARQVLDEASKKHPIEGTVGVNQLLLKEKPTNVGTKHYDGYADNTKSAREQPTTTLNGLNAVDYDENDQTYRKTSENCSVRRSSGTRHADVTRASRYNSDDVDCVDAAFVQTSLKHCITETGNVLHRFDGNRETVDTLLETSTEPYANQRKVNDKISQDRKLYNNGKRQKKRTPADTVNAFIGSTEQRDDSLKLDQNSAERALVPKPVTAVQTEKPRKRLTVAFNYLSTLINQGDFDKFKEVSSQLQTRFSGNFDLMCIIGYLQTSRDLFQTNFDSAKSHIDSTMALVPKTSNPRYFMLELFTAKTRMYITQKKLEKLQTTLDEAMMILETDPVGCTGRAAGWLYINDARNKTAQLSCLNLRNPNALKVYGRLFENAKSSFQRSMTNFKRDGGKDGPFGFGYALCRLVILLMRCGDNGLTMNTLTASADDIHTAGNYLHHLEDSDIVIPKILDMHFRLAKCDYQFRRDNHVRALEHAQIAFELATEMNLLEFTEHAYNRVSFLKSKLSAYVASDDLSEKEVQRILFEETSDTDCLTQSE